jgi:beta-galactosidase/beta-glucuronidase
MSRVVRDLNDNWRYQPAVVPGFETVSTNDAEWEAVRLPHANVELPFSDFDERLYQFESVYRCHFSGPTLAARQRAVIHFEGVMCAARVWLNGAELGGHRGGYTPFSFDVTPFLVAGENVLAVLVDSRERPDIPPFGHVIDYLTYGGIYREVWLEIMDADRIVELRLETRVLDARGGAVLGGICRRRPTCPLGCTATEGAAVSRKGSGYGPEKLGNSDASYPAGWGCPNRMEWIGSRGTTLGY